MPRGYTAEFNNVAVTAIQDLFEIVAAAAKPVALTGLMLAQTTELGDAQEEILRIQIIRGFTVSGSGGTTVTAGALDASDAAFGGTCEANNTTVANTGTTVTVFTDAVNVRSGYIWQPTPEQYIWLAGGARAVVRLPAAPVDSITFSGTLWFIEHG